ncbi:MAG: hypothetical protein LC725_03000 [Lentisphaerae bacterium]|nr:hypothetical protein [Lentisphaerota bacterium]
MFGSGWLPGQAASADAAQPRAEANDRTPLQGQLVWPKSWTVFAPMQRLEAVLPVEVLKTIPDKITLPAFTDLPEREIAARKLDVRPGTTVDLLPFFEKQAVDNTAYVFLEIDSPKDQTVNLGIGGDWWVEVWVNGAPVFDTLSGGKLSGNIENNISILNHQFSAPLNAGRNVLAVRFITGRGTSRLALGGPNEFEAAKKRQAEYDALMAFTVLPPFEERLVFPVDTQAIATAAMTLEFSEPEADLSAGSLVGLQEMPSRQLYFHKVAGRSGSLLDTFERRFDNPVFVRLSKFAYPWEDRALDAIVYTTPPEAGQQPAGSLEVLLKTEKGALLSKNVINDLSAHGQFFSVGFPDALQGKSGVLEAIWKDGDKVIGQAEKAFKVDAPSAVAVSGKIPLRILNEPGAHIDHAPMTVGVPFPRGALFDPARVRLVDEAGKEIPVQTMVTGRWSRFGAVKWLLCDFTVSLKGKGTTVLLEYGPEIRRRAVAPMQVTETDQGFPALDSGRIRITNQGVWFDPDGQGDFQKVLAAEALVGAFVKHEQTGRFSVPDSSAHAVEELGSEKAVIRRTGWFVEPASRKRFCQFVTRFVFHRQSPVVRIFHTWIFTGDGNRDRISEMGWRFDTASGAEPEGFLESFNGTNWLNDAFVVQFNYDRYKLAGAQADVEGRLPGVLGATRATIPPPPSPARCPRRRPSAAALSTKGNCSISAFRMNIRKVKSTKRASAAKVTGRKGVLKRSTPRGLPAPRSCFSISAT